MESCYLPRYEKSKTEVMCENVKKVKNFDEDPMRRMTSKLLQKKHT